jgi:predicted nucleotidyltransferase
MQFGFSDKVLVDIISIIKRFERISKAVIFGSRARGDFKRISDIDLCIYGDLSTQELLLVKSKLSEIDIPWDFDVVVFDRVSPKMQASIIGDGVEIYKKK